MKHDECLTCSNTPISILPNRSHSDAPLTSPSISHYLLCLSANLTRHLHSRPTAYLRRHQHARPGPNTGSLPPSFSIWEKRLLNASCLCEGGNTPPVPAANLPPKSKVAFDRSCWRLLLLTNFPKTLPKEERKNVACLEDPRRFTFLLQRVRFLTFRSVRYTPPEEKNAQVFVRIQVRMFFHSLFSLERGKKKEPFAEEENLRENGGGYSNGMSQPKEQEMVPFFFFVRGRTLI